MGSNDPALKRYFRSISDELPCSRKMKKQVISQIRNSIVDYLQENPNIDFTAVQSHFGTPQEIAASYVDDQDASALLRKMSIKKKVLVIVAGAVVIALMVWAGVATGAAIESHANTERYIKVITE